MPSSRRRLGTISPGTQSKVLYRVPDDGTVLDVVIGHLFIVNPTVGAINFRVWHIDAGNETLPDELLVQPVESLAAKASVRRLQGICMTPGEALWVLAGGDTLSFHLYGQENRL